MRGDPNFKLTNPIDPFAEAGLSGHPLCRMAEWMQDGAEAEVALTPHEAERLDRMKSRTRKAEMMGSFALRRRLVAEMSGVSGELVTLAASEEGAPLLLHPAGWSVSLANKEAYTVVALAEAPGEIGVDIEVVREMDWRPALSMTCSDRERAEIDGAQSDPVSNLRAFYRMWTLKEAVLKTTGRGFRAGPKAVETPRRILQSPGTGQLQAFGDRFDFWTADVDDAVVSLARKRL